ncbi:MAG: hypothetical protein RPV21_08855 [Candidatus Sedimenticola sp. (ex Thyasira tokunagai)]
MNDTFKHGIAEASKLIQAYTYPLFRVGKNSLPDIFASCVFLEMNKSIYLVSAAHAIRGNTSGLLTRGNGQLMDVVGHATVSCSDGKDHFDISAICMNDEIVHEHNINVIPETMLATSVEVTNPHSRAICGFPFSMNKPVKSIDRQAKIITSKCYTFFGFAGFDGDFREFGKSSGTHLGIEFGSGKDDAGKILSTPPWPPRGMSGGGAWLVPDLSCPDLVFLEGIFIEGHKHAKKMYGFSTQITHVIDFINHTHNNGFHRSSSPIGTSRR